MADVLVDMMNAAVANTIPPAHVMGVTVLSDDEIARVEAEAAEKGKADFILDAEVKDEAGQTVARTHGLYQLRAIEKQSRA